MDMAKSLSYVAGTLIKIFCQLYKQMGVNHLGWMLSKTKLKFGEYFDLNWNSITEMNIDKSNFTLNLSCSGLCTGTLHHAINFTDFKNWSSKMTVTNNYFSCPRALQGRRKIFYLLSILTQNNVLLGDIIYYLCLFYI